MVSHTLHTQNALHANAFQVQWRPFPQLVSDKLHRWEFPFCRGNEGSKVRSVHLQYSLVLYEPLWHLMLTLDCIQCSWSGMGGRPHPWISVARHQWLSDTFDTCICPSQLPLPGKWNYILIALKNFINQPWRYIRGRGLVPGSWWTPDLPTPCDTSHSKNTQGAKWTAWPEKGD